MAVLGEGENEVYVSPHIEQLLGFTAGGVAREPVPLVRPAPPRRPRAVERPSSPAAAAPAARSAAECRFLARDGSIKWVHGEAHLMRDELGRPQFLQGVAFDITEQQARPALLLRPRGRAGRAADEELAIARRVQTSIAAPRARAPSAARSPRRWCPPTTWAATTTTSARSPTAPGSPSATSPATASTPACVMMMLQSARRGARPGCCPHAQPERGRRAASTRRCTSNVRERLRHDDHVHSLAPEVHERRPRAVRGRARGPAGVSTRRSSRRAVRDARHLARRSPRPRLGHLRQRAAARTTATCCCYTPTASPRRWMGKTAPLRAGATRRQAARPWRARARRDPRRDPGRGRGWMHEQHDDLSLLVARHREGVTRVSPRCASRARARRRPAPKRCGAASTSTARCGSRPCSRPRRRARSATR